MKKKVTITLGEEEIKWVKEKCINLSAFVEKKIRDEMKKRGGKLNDEGDRG